MSRRHSSRHRDPKADSPALEHLGQRFGADRQRDRLSFDPFSLPSREHRRDGRCYGGIEIGKIGLESRSVGRRGDLTEAREYGHAWVSRVLSAARAQPVEGVEQRRPRLRPRRAFQCLGRCEHDLVAARAERLQIDAVGLMTHRRREAGDGRLPDVAVPVRGEAQKHRARADDSGGTRGVLADLSPGRFCHVREESGRGGRVEMRQRQDGVRAHLPAMVGRTARHRGHGEPVEHDRCRGPVGAPAP